MFTFFYYGTWRELSKDIKIILYKNLAEKVVKENYISEYKLVNKKIQKSNIFKVLVYSNKIDAFEQFIKNKPNWKKLEN